MAKGGFTTKDRLLLLETLLGSQAFARERAEKLYLPIYEWCLGELEQGRPRVVGVSASQGAGKTTLTSLLCQLAAHEGLRAVTISIDDFYLTRAEQVRLAEQQSTNPYLQSRGYPGTHDIALGTRTLTALQASVGEVSIPRYEKSLQGGKGDRLPSAEWKLVGLPVDFIFFEGWMLGFHAVGDGEITDPAINVINRYLREYEVWWSELDALIQLKPRDYRYVIDWRIEAEERMKASGKPGLSAEEIRAYVETFLPAYELYLPGVSLPDGGRQLVVEIGKDRLPIS